MTPGRHRGWNPLLAVGMTIKKLWVTKNGSGRQKRRLEETKMAHNASLTCSNAGGRKIQNSIAYKA